MQWNASGRTTMPIDVKRIATVGLLTFPLLLSSGCFSRVLRADFNEYSGTPDGPLLNGSIPGIPDGDAIQNAETSFVVVDEVIAGKSLRVQGQADFVPVSHQTPSEYRIDWEGFRTFIGNTGTSTISFLDMDGDAALVLEFDGSIGDLRVMSGTEFTPLVMLGSFTHNVEITIHMGGVGSIDFSLQESDDPPDVLNNLAFLDNDFDKLDRISFEGATNATYYMNDLDVFTMSSQ